MPTGGPRAPHDQQRHSIRACSSGGQSASLTTTRSQVRALSRPPANTAGQRALLPSSRVRVAARLRLGRAGAARTHDPPPLADQIASSRSRSDRSDSGYKWPSRSTVKLTEAWPDRTATSFGLAPAAIHTPPPCLDSRERGSMPARWRTYRQSSESHGLSARRSCILSARGFAEPFDGLEPSTPSLPCRLGGKPWQPVAKDRAVSSGLSSPSRLDRLLAVATAGLHKGSIRLDGPAWIRASPAAFQFWASMRWRGG
jgi:hypothetical protein